jgi:replicative DNA helicase
MLSQNSKPISLEAEYALVGALLVGEFGRAEALDIAKPEMFTDANLKIMFQALSKMFLDNSPIGYYELLVRLRNDGNEDRVGGADFIAKVGDGCPDVNAAARYADQVRDFWRRRRLSDALLSMSEATKTPGSEHERLDCENLIDTIGAIVNDNGGGKSLVDAKESVFDAMNKSNEVEVHPSLGMPKFDKAMNIFHPGEVTVLAGRPGGGKSSFMRQAIWRASMSGPVLVFTLEVTPTVLIQQLCCEAAQVPFEVWRDGVVSDEDNRKIIEAMSEFECRNIKIFSRANVSTLQVSLALSQMKATSQFPHLVVIDYLGLMNHGRADRQDLAIGATTRSLKCMAMDRKFPLLLLCQMNRKSEDRGKPDAADRPRLADLRDSGSIEQDADNVLFLWRKERMDDTLTTQARVLTVAKHRNGRVGDMDVMFDMPHGRFFEAGL